MTPFPDRDAGPGSGPEPTGPPMVGIRLLNALEDTTRRIDLQLIGTRGVVVEDGLATTFDSARLWPTVRGLLPPLDQLRADPTGAGAVQAAPVPGPGWSAGRW